MTDEELEQIEAEERAKREAEEAARREIVEEMIEQIEEDLARREKAYEEAMKPIPPLPDVVDE